MHINVIHFIFHLILRLLFRVKVEGDAQQMLHGTPLIVANHDSLLDVLLIGLFLPGAPTVVLTPETFKSRWSRLLLAVVPCIILDPAQPLALKRLTREIRNGKMVAIFPQGRMSTTGGVMKVYDSAGFIAFRCDADIIPVRISGTQFSRFAIMGGQVPRRWFPRVTLSIQAAVKLPPLPVMKPHDRRRRLADEMLKILQCMMFASRPRQTLFESFLDAVELYGRSTRIIEDAREQPETYGDLLKASMALGRLCSRISHEDEILGVLMPNISTTVSLLLGLSAMRRVPAMLNYSAGADAMQGACVAAGIKTVITSRLFVKRARLEPAIKTFSGVSVVYLEDLRQSMGLSDKLWLICRALPLPRSVLRARDPGETALVLFTSGSEARPKGVALSHDAVLANMAQMQAVIDFGPNDKFLNALPMFHTYGLIACTLMPLMTGTRLFLYTSPLRYRAIPEFAYTRDCTYIFGTSTFLGHYARQAHPYDFYKVRVVVSGGEKLSPDVVELWMRKFGLRIMEGYGTTECGPAMALNTPLCYREGSVGRFLPGVEACLTAVPGIQQGSALHVRAPNMMRGYYFYDQPGVLHPPRSEVGEGWYNTGDVVDVDDDGYVTILGRVKRFAKVAGEMVSLELVERIAYHAAPDFKHAATVEQITGRGESTLLFTTDPKLDRGTLLKATHQLGTQELAVARRVVHVASLPLLGSGKTDYVTLGVIARQV
jgi:acyl-[acyl-carrier-protein]-phospholipid O-acyltransferase/long-chain-fatty-acid--[acyl-carrier-protein] ligase